MTTQQEEAIKKLSPYKTENSFIIRSPGRINLIGEHTDYNDGFVLPAAIDKAVYLCITPRKDNEIHLHAIDLESHHKTAVSEVAVIEDPLWPNYLLGVIHQFKQAGIIIPGFDAALTSDVPIGAGLSSSAALECAMAMALNEITNTGFDKLTLVKMAQKAEHEYAGVQCGIMDQFASMFGRHNHVIRLDCRSLEYEYVPFNIEGYKIVLLDTGVKHSLASSEYNVRRIQCEKGVGMIQQKFNHIKSLRDATMEMLNELVLPFDNIVYQRCKYVVEERDRLLQACNDLEKGDLQSFGRKMFETHQGLSKLYEVSCSELDFLVTHVISNPAVIGARMMGGGFGGCTINLVKEQAVDNFITETTMAYKAATDKTLTAYVAVIEDGTGYLR